MTSGKQLPGFVADPTIGLIILRENVQLESSDWDGHTTLPIVLTRNLTVLSAPGRARTLDINMVSQKVQLLPGVVFLLQGVLVVNFRRFMFYANPGFELLTKSPPAAAGQAAPVLRMSGGAFVYRLCVPYSVAQKTHLATPRPAQLAGNQSWDIVWPQPGCSNASDAGALQRCWPGGRSFYYDFAADTVNINELGVSGPGQYIIHALNETALCAARMTEECLRQYGVVGCHVRTVGVGAEVPLTMAAPSPPPALPATLGGSGSGDVQLEVLLPALLGGLAVASLAASALVVCFRRRRKQRGGSPTDRRCGDTGLEGKEEQEGKCCAASPGEDSHPGPTPAAAPAAGSQVGSTPKSLQRGGSAAIAVLVESGESSLADGEHSGPGPAAGPACTPAAASAPGAGAGTALLPSSTGAGGVLAEEDGGRSRGRSVPRPASAAAVVVLTLESPLQDGVRLDLQWGVDFQVEPSVVLGVGAYGRVTEGTYQGRRVAVKTMHVLGAGRGGRHRSRSIMRSLLQEVEVLSRCRHPNVAPLLGACMEPPNVCLVMELMHQSLEQLVSSRTGELLPLQQVLAIAIDVANGLAYLHPTIVHRDLKPANILLDAAGVAKISDFGVSRLQASAVLVTRDPEVGTAPYMAPECFALDNFTLSPAADMYSLGVLLWELLSGQRPWKNHAPIVIAYVVTLQRQRLPLEQLGQQRCPAKLARLLRECWDHDPRRRPSAAEAAKRLAVVREELVLLASAARGAEVDGGRSAEAETEIRPGGSIPWVTPEAGGVAPAAPAMPWAATAGISNPHPHQR